MAANGRCVHCMTKSSSMSSNTRSCHLALFANSFVGLDCALHCFVLGFPRLLTEERSGFELQVGSGRLAGARHLHVSNGRVEKYPPLAGPAAGASV
jgi:hypothetical protein